MKQQKRLNLPAGELPAARVVRRQQPQHPQPPPASTSAARRVAVPRSAHKVAVPHVSVSLSGTSRRPTNDDEDASGSAQAEQPELSGLTVLGAVVERPRRRRTNPTTTASPTTMDVNRHPAHGVRSQSTAGIPGPVPTGSLHLPLGTFTRDKQVTPFSDGQPSSRTNGATAISSSRVGGTSDDNKRTSVAVAPNTQSTSAVSATLTDAQRMLESMTVEEIQESIQELTTQLDPKALAFLKQRGRRSKARVPIVPVSERKPPAQQQGEYVNVQQRTHDGDDHTPLADQCTTSQYDQISAEKLKIATALTSIQTHEELDAVYQRYNPMDDGTEAKGRSIHAFSEETSDSLDDFALACELLRSTSSAQTLWACRVICRRLVNIKRDPSSHNYHLRPLGSNFIDHDRDAAYAPPAWPFPTLLPVSLRCLLDATHSTISSGTGASMLHVTYILQAICAMLFLRECRDHAVDFCWTTGNTEDGSDEKVESAAVYYQHECFDDDVPSLPLSALYAPSPSQTTPTDGGNSDMDGAVFVPSSSSSALADGESFLRDPSWTLLSRMRILPRLAQLLRQGHHLMALHYLDQNAAVNPNMSPQVGQNNTLSIEALSAICSILAMVGQRSPGAASAMAHHPTLMDDLVAMTLLYSDGSARLSEPQLALPTIRLLCILARQSIEAASSLCQRLTESSSFLLQMIKHSVSFTANGSTSSRAKSALHRWTFVIWRTFLRLGFAIDIIPPVLTLATPCFTQCAIPEASIIPDLQSCFTSFLIFARRLSPPGKVDTEMTESTTSIGQMIQQSSLEQLTLKRLTRLPHDMPLLSCDMLRFIASDLRFLNAVMLYRESMGSSPSAGIEREAIASANFLMSIIEARRIGDVAKVALRLAFTPSFPNAHEMSDEHSLRFEACACTFVESVLSLSLTLRHQTRASGNTELELQHTLDSWLLEQLQQVLEAPMLSSTLAASAMSVFETARCRWLNMVHTIVVCFLCDEASLQDSCIKQAVAFATFGRLDCGDELLATALIHSLDSLSDKTSTSMNFSSLLSNIIKKELSKPSNRPIRIDCGTSLYLDMWTIFGSSALHFPSDGTNMAQGDCASFLPMGAFWLWKLLSSLEPEVDQSLAVESTVAVLCNIEEIEATPSKTPSFQAIRMLSKGPKLYFLMGVCLQDETVLSHNVIATSAEMLFDELSRRMSTNDIIDFAIACRMHIYPKSTRGNPEKRRFEALSEEEKMKAVLEPMQVIDSGFSPTTIRALEAYAEDLCKAFLDSGAQYPFRAKAIRMFLSHGFPTKLRCAVVRQLNEGLHLLTLPGDVDLNGILPQFFAGGMPSVDSSHRDSSDLLDCIASVYRKGIQLRRDDSFFASWATGMLARSLGIAASQEFSVGRAAMKNRMKSLDPVFANRVIITAVSWFSSTGSLKDLVKATLTYALNSDGKAPPVSLDGYNDETWGEIVDHFRGLNTTAGSWYNKISLQ